MHPSSPPLRPPPSPSSLLFTLSLPPFSPQCMRDASWRKQREMGPITALGTKSWLINSNLLTNCFFTRNHLSLSHGTHMHEKPRLRALPNSKKKNPNTHTTAGTQCAQNFSLDPLPPLHRHTCEPTQTCVDPLAQLYLPRGQYVDYVRVADYCTVTVKETNVFHRQASISARGLLATHYGSK